MHAKKSDSSLNQSSILLKDGIANKYQQFQSTEHQDPSEFMQNLISLCGILSRLTQSEIISSYKCSICAYLSDNSDSNERFKNIAQLTITGTCISEIVLNNRTQVHPHFMRCSSSQI